MGDGIHKNRADWDFSGEVAENFVPHIKRSVPYYEDGHDLVCYLSDFFCLKNSTCYELGCSTGELIRKLARYNAHKPQIRWVGIDVEEKMVQKAKEHCKDMAGVEIVHDDIVNFNFEAADMVISYYCVQFVPECYRQELFNKIYQSLNWGGCFILFEKVRAPDARFQDMMTMLYRDYKLRQGFTSDEIFNKDQGLKSKLKPFSTEGNLGLLKRAGFTDIMTVMKHVCFEGFIAVK
jgi:tRNA (cmo5U34)-methyltransferase